MIRDGKQYSMNSKLSLLLSAIFEKPFSHNRSLFSNFTRLTVEAAQSLN